MTDPNAITAEDMTKTGLCQVFFRGSAMQIGTTMACFKEIVAAHQYYWKFQCTKEPERLAMEHPKGIFNFTNDGVFLVQILMWEVVGLQWVDFEKGGRS